METVSVNLQPQPDRSYPILIEPGLLERAAELLAARFPGRVPAVICDSNLAMLHGAALAESLRARGLDCGDPVVFPAGEASKSRERKAMLEDELFARGLGRDTVVLALGGGVTGDLAGFVAATYARGVPLVQLPTSLLAMVDSSIGGKVAVDVPWGKNLVGAFHQPALVLIDPAVLRTLPPEQFTAGMAEVVKHGVIRDREFFELLEQRAEGIAGDERLLTGLIARNCRIKAAVVEADEREGNLRQILNFGHTIGHALETLSGYRWLHGQAVAAGMAIEAELAARLGLMPSAEVARLDALLRRLGLPVDCAGLRVGAEQVLELTRLDKKARGGQARYALPSALGAMATDRDGNYGIKVEDQPVRAALLARGALA